MIVGRGHGAGFAELVEALSDPPNRNEHPDALMSNLGSAGRLAEGDLVRRSSGWIGDGRIAVRPIRGARKHVAVSRFRAAACVEGTIRPDFPVGAAWILATAPDHYEACEVDGTEVYVIVNPLDRWARHPILVRAGRLPTKITRAWEVFSSDGEPLGLALSIEDGVVGVAVSGDVSPEDTLAAAAWQVAVNR